MVAFLGQPIHTICQNMTSCCGDTWEALCFKHIQQIHIISNTEFLMTYEGHSISHGSYFSWSKMWHNGKKGYIYIWKHMACTWKCYHQMGAYVEKPPVGGKWTMCVFLNHAFFVFLWRTEYIQNKKSNTNYLYKPQTLNNLQSWPQSCILLFANDGESNEHHRHYLTH